MSDQDGIKQYVLPAPDVTAYDFEKEYELEKHWKQQGQPWRTKPEISDERQKYLSERRKIVVDGNKGIYPFKDIALSRADIEWLLATHNDGRGPTFWREEGVRYPIGLDLRGANLRGVDLHSLPLAYLRGSFETARGMWSETEERRNAAAIHLEGVGLTGTHLEEANLVGVRLDGVDINYTHFENAMLHDANFRGATLRYAHLEGAYIIRAEFTAELDSVYLDGAHLNGINLEDATFRASSLVGATLKGANLKGAEFIDSSLEDADFSGANLENTDFSDVKMEGTNLEQTHVGSAYFRKVFFDHKTSFAGAKFSNDKGIGPKIGVVYWGDVDLTAVEDWPSVKILRDEDDANNPNEFDGTRKDSSTRMKEYQSTVRAYRQLAVILRNQGLTEDANRFANRAQLIQRKVYKSQRKTWQYLGSLFLDLLTGYGYKPLRSFLAYLIVILTFATAYFIIGRTVGPALSPLGSVVFSMTSFHGRGFFPGGITLDDPLTVVAALEAFIGLLIEVTFIATLTRRLFGG